MPRQFISRELFFEGGVAVFREMRHLIGIPGEIANAPVVCRKITHAWLLPNLLFYAPRSLRMTLAAQIYRYQSALKASKRGLEWPFVFQTTEST